VWDVYSFDCEGGQHIVASFVLLASEWQIHVLVLHGIHGLSIATDAEFCKAFFALSV
jgi:hypothetical protein